MFRDAGFPDGAYVNIYATNEQIEWVIADPRVRGVSVTGSERAGAAVAEIAGRNLKKVVLELGGSDPFIVLGTDDLDKTVEDAVAARIDNAGQSCNAAKRFIVIDELYEPFLEKFTAALTAVKQGDPRERETEVGPLSSQVAADRLEDQVRRAVEQGATVVAGGKRNGNYFEPTVLTDITPENDDLPRRAVRPGRPGLSRAVGGGGGRAGKRHAVRARLLRDDERPGAGRARRGPDRRRHGLREHRRRRQLPSCRSAARNAPASDASSAATGPTSSSTRS